MCRKICSREVPLKREGSEIILFLDLIFVSPIR